jgi:hypothetical protein
VATSAPGRPDAPTVAVSSGDDMTMCERCGKPIVKGERMVVHQDEEPTWNAQGVLVSRPDHFTPYHERCFSKDQELVARVIYEAYYAVLPRLRHRVRWVMAPDMLDWLKALFPPLPPPSPPHWTPLDLWPSDAYSQHNALLGHPVETRDGIEGIHVEVDG